MKRNVTIFAVMFCAFSAHAADAPHGDVVLSAAAVVEHGSASYYSDKLQGKPTASGEPHDQNALTAASRDLPLGSTAKVTNLKNGKTVDVEITDRGPYAKGRVIDLSKRAADSIGINKKQGVAPVRVEASAKDQPTTELQQQVVDVGAKKRAAQTPPTKAPAAKMPVAKAPTVKAAPR